MRTACPEQLCTCGLANNGVTLTTELQMAGPIDIEHTYLNHTPELLQRVMEEGGIPVTKWNGVVELRGTCPGVCRRTRRAIEDILALGSLKHQVSIQPAIPPPGAVPAEAFC